jgi:hypothetical protein
LKKEKEKSKIAYQAITKLAYQNSDHLEQVIFSEKEHNKSN